MSTIKIVSMAALFMFLIGCEEMDDNYDQYLEIERVYSPKIDNLTAEVGLRTATLRWENPQGDIAKRIVVDYQSDSLKFDHMVDSAVLNDLEIKGYDVSVYTVDAHNNYSVPVTIQIFPNGEN